MVGKATLQHQSSPSFPVRRKKEVSIVSKAIIRVPALKVLADYDQATATLEEHKNQNNAAWEVLMSE